MRTCNHVEAFKADNGLDSYETIYSNFVARRQNDEPSYHKMFARCVGSDHCNNHRLLACLNCIYFCCYEKHVAHHVKTRSHLLYVELSNGHLLCLGCDDYVYDSQFETIAQREGFPDVRTWQPNDEDVKILKDHDHSVAIGIRGLINMGQTTCFMSVVMQAFFHTPMLRDYFFSDKYGQHKCPYKSSADCLFCVFFRLFQTYYDFDDKDMDLHEVLYFTRKNVPLLKANKEHDAQEFLLAMLHWLDRHSSSPTADPNVDGIINVIFRGQQHSDVKCPKCGKLSTTVEFFYDVSLDIPEPPNVLNLCECLRLYTECEVLTGTKCGDCGVEGLTKQMTFSLLPLVIVIHLKRFQVINESCFKKTDKLLFPLELDMTPYVSDHCNYPERPVDAVDNRYDLYAVVVHDGVEIGGGHYRTFVRPKKSAWFECNDLNVLPASEPTVASSEGYMLFYHKTVLFYE